MTTTTVGSRESRVLAILDTGASRCVMGANLLNRFVRQFGEDIRSKIRVMPSSVRFRFGNNQTLTSQKRLLLPLLASQDTWWLSIEIVPGSTPLLFSKKALKQLGSTLDTRRDSLQLHKLHREISLSTGPTGLYMLDLPDLCNHDVRDASETPRCERALHVCSAKSEPPLQCNAKPEPPLHVSTVQAHMSLELGSGMSVAHKFGMNSGFPSKYPGSDNVLSELGSDDPPDCQHLGTEPFESKTHEPVVENCDQVLAQTHHEPLTAALEPKVRPTFAQHSRPFPRSVNRSNVRIQHQQAPVPRAEACSSPGSHVGLQCRRPSNDARRPAVHDEGGIRQDQEGTDLPGSDRGRCRLEQMGGRAHGREAYLIFVERYVEMGEAAEAALAEPSHTKKVPKSKPMPKARLPVTSGHMSEPEASEEDPWALLEEPAGSEPLRAEVLMLRGRMEQMEVAIQQMLGAIQQMASKPQ